MFRNSKLIAFCTTARPDESKIFYQSVIGLTLVDDGPFALVFDANGTELRIQKINTVSPSNSTAIGWAVTDIETQVRALVSHDITCERYSGMQQDQLGIWTTPSGSKVAWFRDPDDNILSITEHAAA